MQGDFPLANLPYLEHDGKKISETVALLYYIENLTKNDIKPEQTVDFF